MSNIDNFLDGDTSKPGASQIDNFLGDSQPPARGFKGWGRDIAATAVKGAIGVPETLVGLADIPTGGAVGKFLENENGSVGFRPKQAKELVNDWHSDATKAAQQKFQNADGFVDKAVTAIQNPSLIATAVGESLPLMGAGGVAARGLMTATKLGQMGAKGAAIAGGLGEGITMAGSAAEQIRQETPDGRLTPTQSGIALATGALGTAFSIGGGKLASRLGVGDVDTMIAQGSKGMAKEFADDAAGAAAKAAANPLVDTAEHSALRSIPASIIKGAISEGFLEELPQSVAEQVLQNIALGKDWSKDVDAAAVMGVLSGGAMGGAAGGFHAFSRPGAEQPADGATSAEPANKASPLQLGFQPDPLVVFPDGTTGRRAEIENYIASLPESQQIEARAKLMGYGTQRAAEPEKQASPGLDRVRQAYAAQLQALQDQEQGDPSVPQTTPPDGAAVLAQQRAQKQAELDAVAAANRAVASPDDEIFQSTRADGQTPIPLQTQDYLAQVRQAVRSGTKFTTQDTVNAVRSAMEDAWLAKNVSNEPVAASSVAPVDAANNAGNDLQSEFDQAGNDVAIAANDARVRTGRILSGLQNIFDAGADNTIQAIVNLNRGLEKIGDPRLDKEEVARVRRMSDSYFGFRGATQAANLPGSGQRAMPDAYADNASLEGRIKERKPSVVMGLDPAKGSLSAGAAIAVDTGAAGQAQQAAAMAQTPAANQPQELDQQTQQSIRDELQASQDPKANTQAPDNAFAYTQEDPGQVPQNIDVQGAVQTKTTPTRPPVENKGPASPSSDATTTGADQSWQPKNASANPAQAGAPALAVPPTTNPTSNVTQAPEAQQSSTQQAQAGTTPATNEGLSNATTPSNNGTQAQSPAGAPAQAETTSIKGRDGKTYHVLSQELNSDKSLLRTFTEDGKPRGARIHRDNLDQTGDKRAADAAENANNPLFDVITRKQGEAFSTSDSAKRELLARGMQDTHEVISADAISSGTPGYLIAKKPSTPASAPAAPVPATQAQASDVATAANPQAAVTPAKTGKKLSVPEQMRAKVADYLTPGNIVQTGPGTYERIISYTPANEKGDSLSITSEALVKENGAFVPDRREPGQKKHSTHPSTTPAYFKQGPVYRATAAPVEAEPLVKSKPKLSKDQEKSELARINKDMGEYPFKTLDEAKAYFKQQKEDREFYEDITGSDDEISHDDDANMSDGDIEKFNERVNSKEKKDKSPIKVGGWTIDYNKINDIYDEDMFSVVSEQGFIYRGLNNPGKQAVFHENGDVTLISGVNFDSQMSGVSMTPYKEVAIDYATRTENSKSRQSNGVLLKITKDFKRSDLTDEGDHELAWYGGPLTVKKGEWELIENPSNKAAAQTGDAAAATPVASKQAAPDGKKASDHLGVNSQPISEGGKPFKTREDASNAKKQQPMLRVVPVKGGFALAPKTEKQLAAEAKASKRLRQPNTSPAGEPISAHAFIAATGGLNKNTRNDLGIGDNPRIGNRTLFAASGGLSIEQATEKLIAEQYLPEGASHNDAYALIRKSLTTPQYNSDGIERISQAEQAARHDDYRAAQEDESKAGWLADLDALDITEDDAHTSGYDESSDPIKMEVNALLAQADALGIDTETIKEEAHEATRNGSEQDYFEAQRSQLQAAIRQGDGSRSNQADAGENPEQGREAAVNQGGADRGQDAGQQGSTAEPVLTSPTREEIEAKQYRAESEAQRNKSQRLAAEMSAAQDEDRKRIAKASEAASSTFTLGGDAMDNLTGQRSVFDAPAEQEPKAVTPPEVKPAPGYTSDDAKSAEDQLAQQLGEIIDKMTAGDVNKIAARYLPDVGLKATVSKVKNKAMLLDFTIANPFGVAAEFGFDLPDSIRGPLEAKFEGRLTDASELEQKARETKLFERLYQLAAEYERAVAHRERAIANGSKLGSSAFDWPYQGKTMTVDRVIELLKTSVQDASKSPDYSKVSAMVSKTRPEIFKTVEGEAGKTGEAVVNDAAKPDPVNAKTESPKPVVSHDEFPLSEATRSYDGISQHSASRARSDRDQFVKVIQDEYDAAEKVAETPEQRAVLESEVQSLKADYLSRYKQMMGVRSEAYSGFFVGRSNLNVKQADKRNSALDKANDAFGKWLAANTGRIKSAVISARNADQLAAVQAAKDAKAAEKERRDLELMGKLLAFKNGDDLRFGAAIVTRVSMDKDGYPNTVTVKDANGAALINNKISLSEIFGGKGLQSIQRGKQEIRRLVNLVRKSEIQAGKEISASSQNPDILFSRGKNDAMTNSNVVGNQGGRSADDNSMGTDEDTGLPLNSDGTVTVYHHTSKANAEAIRKTGRLKAQAEPDVYVTTRKETDTGYGDTAVSIRVRPDQLLIDDEFPDGRKDFRLSVGRPGGSIKVSVSNESTAPTGDGAQTLFGRSLDDGTRPSSEVTQAEITQASKAVEATVRGLTSGMENAPNVVVAFDMNDSAIPEAVRRADKKQRSGGATGTPEGFFHNGTVYLIASKLKTPDDVARVFAHEALGHYGLRGVFGDGLKPILQQIATMRKAEVDAKIKEYGLRGVNSVDRLTAAEEVLAELAQKTPTIGFVTRTIAAIRTWLRANVTGLSALRLSDAELIRSYILPARGWVERGMNADSGAIQSPLFSREDQTKTEAFKRWFGDSKVVDEDGNPLVVYHGTNADFTAFNIEKQWVNDPGILGKGAYFSAKRSIAQSYGGNVKEVYISLKNPLRVAEKPGPNGWASKMTNAIEVAKNHGVDLSGIDDDPKDAFMQRIERSNQGYKAIFTDAPRAERLAGKFTKSLKNHGFDGIIYAEDVFQKQPGVTYPEGAEFYDGEYVVFNPTQIKSATSNNGDFDPQNPDIRFSRSSIQGLKSSALDQIDQTLNHPGTVSLWHKTVGTMRNLAERNPLFKPVFEGAQRFIDDVSTLTNDAADRAPRIIPRMETLSDLKKRPISSEDNKALVNPLFGGTLLWGRDTDGKPALVKDLEGRYSSTPAEEKAQIMLRTRDLDPRVLGMWKGLPVDQYESSVNSRFREKVLKPGIVWTDDELKSMFKLNDKQISLYREARAAIDRSIDMTARADMLRTMGEKYADLRDMVMDQESLKDAMTVLTEQLQEDARSEPDSSDDIMALNNLIVDIDKKAHELMKKGYAPLSRFGQYTVDVVDPSGERQYFGMFESKSEANKMKLKMATAFPGSAVVQGTMSQQAYKLFAGITPESLELFGNMLGLESSGDDTRDKTFQKYLQLTKNNHSAIKRLIERKGIDGYSEDIGRVLASFVYSNARQAAGGLNAGSVENAINAIPKEQGQLKDVAMGLREYIREPQEEGQVVRSMLFSQYLGGSVASALVNMTQPFAVTLPWLSQFGGMKKAGSQLSRAINDMRKSSMDKGFKYESDLASALKKAEDDGVVSPQEIHQIMAQARGESALQSGDGTRLGDAKAAALNNLERLKVLWGQPFALAEQFNRRSTFIAAYRTAKETGMANAFDFAQRAVMETQFVYSKANKPTWARGAVGGTLMTFKTYSISYLELLNRTWNAGSVGSPERAAGRRAVAWSVAMLMLMSGAGGLPFLEDLDDLIDGAGQMMGYNVSSKQWRKDVLRETLGKELGDFVVSGVSGLPGSPVDVSGRLGMGNLIPGTGLILTKPNRDRDMMEIAGPAGDFVSRGFTGVRKFLTGDVGGAAMEVAPTAVRNAVKGIDMASSGMYKDAKGYKVIDTTLDEAVAKFIGFQPKSVAEVQGANSFMLRSESYYKQVSAEIKSEWAKALFDKDDAALQDARDRLAAWNKNNPDQPMTIKMPDVWKKVREMGKDRTQRIVDTAPKALRQQMRAMTAEAQ